jgi:hypothetical protein
MPVDEDINLDASDGLSQEDIDELKRQADELENIAVKSEKNVETIKKNYKDVFEGKDFKTKDIMMGDPKPLDISKLESLDEINKRFERIEEVLKVLGVGSVDKDSDIDKLEEGLLKAEKERIEMKKIMKEMERDIIQQIGNVRGGIGKFFNITGNPFGYAKGQIMSFVTKAGVVGALIGFIYQIAEIVYDDIQNSFKAGGANDIRKMMEDRDKEIVELDDILSRRSGRVFFTGDVDLKQGAPTISNTERLRDQVLRYQSLHLE